MTSRTSILTKEADRLELFPDYPPRDDMQNWLYLYEPYWRYTTPMSRMSR